MHLPNMKFPPMRLGCASAISSGKADMFQLKVSLALKDRPTALFVSNNQMTLGALQAFRELGVKIPKDMSIVGLDDTDWSVLLDPPLTVIYQSPCDMGNKAGKMLLQRIFKKRKRFKTKVIPAELIQRQSSGPPRR